MGPEGFSGLKEFPIGTRKILVRKVKEMLTVFLQTINTWNVKFRNVYGFSIEMAGEASPTTEIILQTTQLCCFPFAVDTNEEMLTSVQM